jgi:hypothetical protein
MLKIKKMRTYVLTTPELKEFLWEQAKQEYLTVSEYCCVLIHNYFDVEEEPVEVPPSTEQVFSMHVPRPLKEYLVELFRFRRSQGKKKRRIREIFYLYLWDSYVRQKDLSQDERKAFFWEAWNRYLDSKKRKYSFWNTY